MTLTPAGRCPFDGKPCDRTPCPHTGSCTSNVGVLRVRPVGEPAPTVADASSARPRETQTELPLALQAAYAVYTAIRLAEDCAISLSLGEFLADIEELQPCLLLAQVALATCGRMSQLSQLRTVAVRVLDAAPELGAELVEILAQLDAQLSGQA